MLSFPPFRLDLDAERLWRHDEELRIRRKPFAILRYLVQHPQRLVTHGEIVDAVWGKVAMSESLLRTHIRDLRLVLGEGVVETVAGRGYRFIAEVKNLAFEDSPAAPPEQRSSIVGRGAELELLDRAFGAARHRGRGVVLIAGEAGVGKTMLVDAFLERARTRGPLLVGRGACVEQYGNAEVYLPVLDALGSLCRGRGGERVIEVLERHAPSWLAQLHAFARPERLETSALPGRTMRELAEALEALSNDAPVILVLEDLHWTDPSTAELLAFLGARREPARILVVATYRATDLTRGHPLARVTSELVAHRQATVVELGAFSEEVARSYVDARWPGNTFPPELAHTLCDTTGGNPLYLSILADDLEAQKLIDQRDGTWRLATALDDVAARRPDGIRRLIDTQIDRLPPREQRIIEVAAVAGMTLTAGLIAHALDDDPDEIDSACELLASGQRLLQYAGTEAWPDGTVQSRYAFGHALFQHAARGRVTAATGRAWHRRIAERLEAGYADRTDAVAALLAIHFEEARLPLEAARYHLAAGDSAGRRFGTREAITHYERARTLLDALPAGPEHDRLEMRMTRALGWKVFQLHGITDAAVPLLERSRELATRLDDRAHLAEVVMALQSLYLMRSELRKASDQYRAIDALAPDPSIRGRAGQLELVAMLLRGEVTGALAHMATLGIDRPVVPGGRPLFVGMSQGAFALWLTGKPDDATALVRRAFDASVALDDLWSRAAILSDWAVLHAWRREPARAGELANQALELATRGGFGLWSNRAELLSRWAEVELSPQLSPERATELLSRSWKGVAGFGHTLPALLEAMVRARLGRAEEALDVLATALGSIERSEERWLEPELHRLIGEIVRATSPARAEASFATALEIARRQASPALELRAALGLHAASAGAREHVARALASIAGGADEPDVIEARRILAV